MNATWTVNAQRLAWGLATMLALHGATARAEDDETRFAIRRFDVSGNTLLPTADIERLVTPFTGEGRNYGDVQQALETLQEAYRARGYGTVQVHVPEQELTGGVVALQVKEGVIGKVTIRGNQHFDEANIRAALPDLKEGAAPNMIRLSENVQLSNENPAKQVDVVLGVSGEEGKVDARVDVTEDSPQRVFVTLDDTGNQSSGRHRVGLSYQHANVVNRDQVVTLAYITAPDAPDGVKSDVYSLGYRVPLYALGDSIDVVYANSSSSTPSTIGALGSSLGITGKGEVVGLRYNHIFARHGEYTSKLVAALDHKFIDTTCRVGNVPVPLGTAGCTPFTLMPLSLTYSGRKDGRELMFDYYVGVVRNIVAPGRDYAWPFPPDGVHSVKRDKYSAASGYRVRNDFAALRLGGSLTLPLSDDWLMRAALTAQATSDSLVGPERLGLAGVNAVRGYRERADGGVDSGLVLNAELYTPELSGWLGIPGNLKALAFYDVGRGRNNSDGGSRRDVNIAGAGIGLRYNFKKDYSFRYDFATVAQGLRIGAGVGREVIEDRGDFRSHFSLAIAF